MKALSIKQPWASFILEGPKTIELRSWNTNYRGPIFIHASAKPKKKNWPLSWQIDNYQVEIKDNQYGAILGKAYLIGVKYYESRESFIQDKTFHLCDVWDEDVRYGFVLKNKELFKESIPYKGSLGIWNYPRENQVKLGE